MLPTVPGVDCIVRAFLCFSIFLPLGATFSLDAVWERVDSEQVSIVQMAAMTSQSPSSRLGNVTSAASLSKVFDTDGTERQGAACLRMPVTAHVSTCPRRLGAATMTVTSWATVAVWLQVLVLYYTTARHKSGDHWHEMTDGSAIYFTFGDERLSTPLAQWLITVLPHRFMNLLTTGVLHWEYVGPFLVLLGMEEVRLVSALLLVVLHLGFASAVNLGPLFSIICPAIWIMMLPPLFWDLLSSELLLPMTPLRHCSKCQHEHGCTCACKCDTAGTDNECVILEVPRPSLFARLWLHLAAEALFPQAEVLVATAAGADSIPTAPLGERNGSRQQDTEPAAGAHAQDPIESIAPYEAQSAAGLVLRRKRRPAAAVNGSAVRMAPLPRTGCPGTADNAKPSAAAAAVDTDMALRVRVPIAALPRSIKGGGVECGSCVVEEGDALLAVLCSSRLEPVRYVLLRAAPLLQPLFFRVCSFFFSIQRLCPGLSSTELGTACARSRCQRSCKTCARSRYGLLVGARVICGLCLLALTSTVVFSSLSAIGAFRDPTWTVQDESVASQSPVWLTSPQWMRTVQDWFQLEQHWSMYAPIVARDSGW